MMNESVEKWLAEQFGDDKDTIAAVYGEYLAGMADALKEAQVALAAGDFPLLDQVAHKLKGSALMVGDARFASESLLLRDAAKASDAQAAAASLARLAALDKENRS